MHENSTNTLLIFIKNPKKGNVKTRLAATVGDDKALEIYEMLLEYTRKVALQVQANRQVWYSRFITDNDDWNHTQFTAKKQVGGSLGQRMKYAFEQAFNNGCQEVVIIGSDCAELHPAHIEQAYESLQKNDVVIGPSEDGGYYLLGMSRFLPFLFEDKPWSTDDVFQQTLTDCKNHNFSCHILEELNDVDNEEDWEQVKNKF